MKKLAALLCFTMFFCSCEKKSITGNQIDHDADAYKQMLISLDDLNASYGYMETRAGGKPYVVAAADAAGNAIGGWIGKNIGAGLGVITGVPMVGVAGYLAGRKYGGWAGAVGASALAEKYYNPSMSTTSPEFNETFVPNTIQQTISSNLLSEDLSVGDLHNYGLYRLVANGNTYILADGTIKMEKLFSDLQSLTEITGYEDPVILDEEGKSILADFYVQLATVLSEANSNHEEPNITMIKMQQAMENVGMPTQEVEMIIPLISVLTACVSTLDTAVIKEYETDYLNLIEKSQLSEDKKKELAEIGSVSIMSTAMWTK